MTRSKSREPARRPSGHHILPYILIFLAIGLIYRNSLDGEFVLDDVASIVENPHITAGQSVAAALRPPKQDPDAPRWRGPVVGLSLAPLLSKIILLLSDPLFLAAPICRFGRVAPGDRDLVYLCCPGFYHGNSIC